MAYTKYIPIIEFTCRLYLAYYLIDYGVAKLTGGMFSNASPAILNTELYRVDMFHLTWYWFHKNILLSYFVGFFQIVSAVFLLFNRTVLIGCLIAFPILLNILLVDIYCTPSPALSVRVFLYITLLLLFCFYRKDTIRKVFNLMLQPKGNVTSVGAKYWVLIVPITLVSLLLLEILITKIITGLIKL
jgi:hypothetical protein